MKMQYLSALDASFLHMETPEMPMHVGGMNLFELPRGFDGDFYEVVKRHVQQRLHLAPIFTRKLALMPFELANPVWIEDDALDLDYHVRKIVLPKPGSLAQLQAYVGRLHSSLLDRSRPLWEFYIFEGLENGQAAFYSKIHHAALDGQGAAALAQVLLDISPVPRDVPPPLLKRKQAYQPSVSELLSAAAQDAWRQSVQIAKTLPQGVKAAGALLKHAWEARGQEHAKTGVGFAPRTPLNVSVTNQRLFATASLPFNEVRAIAKAFEVSVNDVVLATCSGALRAWLARHAALPSRSLLTAMPVSLRQEGNTDLNNQVSMMRMHLASNIADPVKRLQRIHAHAKTLKKTLGSVKSVLPTNLPSIGLPWLMTGLTSFYARSRLADRMSPLANLVISNVPGPQMDLYLAGAKMLSNFPVSIVAHGMGLNITVQSYAGKLDIGMIACRRAMPDLADFAEMMTEAHAELLAAAKAVVASDVGEKPASEGKARRRAAAKAVKPAGAEKAAKPVKPAKSAKAKQTEAVADASAPAKPKRTPRARKALQTPQDGHTEEPGRTAD
ncbi:wax ester/triacylglycerol synthase family O-acyltransferase [Massilia sp. W12]|uniref:WS/DGAT/MGAT family O-acyltransferase n=1 Tax=Massilia sp. W12 TaxID=3126507 RepID=UPI0030CE9022